MNWKGCEQSKSIQAFGNEMLKFLNISELNDSNRIIKSQNILSRSNFIRHVIELYSPQKCLMNCLKI